MKNLNSLIVLKPNHFKNNFKINLSMEYIFLLDVPDNQSPYNSNGFGDYEGIG
jgi:hypothetical protein